MTDKTAKELQILDSFKAIYANFPTDPIIHNGEREQGKPDFLLGDLGIELTDYTYEQNSYQNQGIGDVIHVSEQQFKKLVEQAQLKFEAEYQVPLLVYFEWHRHNIPRKNEIDILATSASTLVANFIPQGNSNMSKIQQHQLRGNPLDAFLHSVLIFKTDAMRKGNWQETKVMSEAAISIPILEEIIANKSDKLPIYLHTCKRAWLIITNVADIAALTVVPENVQQHVFRTDFEHVFFHDISRLSYYILTVLHASQ